MQAPSDRLALLYRISQSLSSTLDLDEVLNRMLDEVIAAVNAERAFLMLRDEGGRLAFRAARGMDQDTITAPEFQVSRTVVERVASEGQPLLTSDAQREAWLSQRASIVGLRLHSILCVPLQHKGSTRGVVYLDNSLQAGIFRQEDLELLTAIAASAAIAIENARLYQLAVDKGRMERELQLARSVQASLIPAQMPQVPGFEFAAYWQPALEVSGDFYDFPALADGAGSDSGARGIVMGDVAGKGMPAALFMALTRSVVRACLSQASPGEAITRANRLICPDSTGGEFVTLFCARLDAARSEMVYVNAGHNPPLWYRARDDAWLSLARTGLILGFDAGETYAERVLRFEPGDFLLCYTDGATDALDAGGHEYGEEGLARALAGVRRAPAAEIVSALRGSLAEHTQGSLPFDDITLVAVKKR